MKKIINKSAHLLTIALAHFLINSSIFAQAPQKMSYQAVIRNSSNALVTNSSVGMRISILQSSSTGGSAVYVETQIASTNANGLVSLEIGTGTVVSGTFAGINWSTGPYFIKTETDPTGGTNYTISGSRELMSVPYALFSANGTPGPQGIQGLPGATGPTGVTGLTGAAGTNGAVGTTGATGLTGPAGLAGTNGINGTNGIDGTNGTNGSFPPGTVAGEMNYWNGTAWVTVAPGTTGQNLTYCNGVPTWGACPAALPTVTTTAVSLITNTSASSGGMVTSDGGTNVYSWGVCWSTSANPTLANSFLQNTVSSGSFSSALSGLTQNTTYYVRAYATNSVGTAYGNEVSFTTANNVLLAIGQSYQGGIIAYILQAGDPGYDASVQHGLIAAPSDQSTGAEWGCYGTQISGADGAAIGTGNQNTIDIMNGCATAGIAARLCGNLVLGGYSDWYLPSINELSQLYVNSVAIGGFANNYYWSSTESDASYAWLFGLTNGSAFYNGKNYAYYVRAVRAF